MSNNEFRDGITRQQQRDVTACVVGQKIKGVEWMANYIQLTMEDGTIIKHEIDPIDGMKGVVIQPNCIAPVTTLSTPYEQGLAAHRSGSKGMSDNPYANDLRMGEGDTELRRRADQWHQGWLDAMHGSRRYSSG